MDTTYWHKQLSDKPLFPDLIWSKPENKQTAGKLLIIGGNIHGFAAVGQAYQVAQSAGIGQVRIILPDSLQKTVNKLLPEAIFVSSTPSGSFAKSALAEFIDQASWADGVLVAGDLGRNSETAIVLEKFVTKYGGPLTLTKDGADYFTRNSGALLNRTQTTLVVSLAQLQQLAKNARYEKPFTFDMGLTSLVSQLHTLTERLSLNIMVKHLDTIFVAVAGQVSTTKINIDNETAWRIPVAAASVVWWLQNPTRPFESLTTSIPR